MSILLHLVLIGKFDFNLSNSNERRDLIEARLTLPQILSESAKQQVPAKKPNEKPLVRKQADQKKPVEQEKIKQPEVQEVINNEPILPETAPIEESTPIEKQVSEAPTPLVSNDTAEPNQDNQKFPLEPIEKPEAYRYVEAEFDVYADKEEAINRSVAGSAKSVYQLSADGTQYQIRSVTQANGLISLIVPDLLQTSIGNVGDHGLKPEHYLYQFGDKKNKTFSANFDWEQKKLSLYSERGEQTFDLQDGTQDLLSFMYQFMFEPPLQNMQLNITNGKKLGAYDYTFEGEETLVTKIGEIKTIHILRTAPQGEKKTELWLAIDYKHVPVKIRETSGNGKMYELLINKLDARAGPSPPQ